MPALVTAIVVFVAVIATLLVLGRQAAGRASKVRPSRRGALAADQGDQSMRVALEASGRRRAHATREAADQDLARAPRDLAAREPVAVTEETLGVTRREFFNRSLLVVVGFTLASVGTAVLAFLWPPRSTAGFGAKIKVSGLAKILAQIEAKKTPFYVPAARTWLQRYPPNALPKAKKVYKPVVYAGMQSGVVALYQRCPHLGCRVPWCQSSQWFECPCHGSKYNAVGEKKAGPAPRGMDRFPIEVSGDDITINTETVLLGPPIGTNTTGQEAEGPLCV